MRILRIAALFAASITFMPSLALAQSPAPDATGAALDAALSAAVKAAHIPSAAILVSVDGNVVYSRAFGNRDLATSTPADVSTHYEIGSMTKQFTAAAILQLQEAGKLSIDDSLAKYLPKAPHASELTLRNLLSQRSGLVDYLEVPGVDKRVGTQGSYEKIVATIAGKPLLFKPGSQFRYSNTNYIILGRVVEIVSRDSYKHYVQTHEFDPAGMTNTAFIADEPRLPDMALAYVTAKGVATPAPVLNDGWAWSAGNIVSTVGDFDKWMEALESGKIVSPADYALMTAANASTHDSGDDYYAFGLVTSKLEGQTYVWHNGGTLGFRSDGAYFPAQRTRIIVFTNSGDAGPEQLMVKTFNVLHPEFAAALTTPAAGEDVALTARIKAFFLGVLSGHIDRSQMNAKENAHMTDEHVKEVDAQLAQFGPVQSFTYKGVTKDSTGETYRYLVQFEQGPFNMDVLLEPGTGKIAAIQLASP